MEESYETKTKSGKIEERILKDKGKFVRYTYIDKATGKATKDKLILIGKDQKAYFMIPTGERELAIPAHFDLGASVKDGEMTKNIKNILDEIK